MTINHKKIIIRLFSIICLLIIGQVSFSQPALACLPQVCPDEYDVIESKPGCAVFYDDNGKDTFDFCVNSYGVNTDQTKTIALELYGGHNEVDAFTLGPYTSVEVYVEVLADNSCDSASDYRRFSNNSATPGYPGSSYYYTLGSFPQIGNNDAECIVVTYTNQAPQSSTATLNQNYGENDGSQVIDLNSYFTDYEGRTMTFSLGSDTISPFAPLSIVGGALVINVTPNSTGSGSVTVTASDGNLTGNMTLNVTVTGVDDPPQLIAPISDLTVSEDSTNFPINLNNVFSDDGAMTFAVTNNDNPGLVSTNISGSTLTLSFAANQAGSASITVQANDGSNTTSDTFNVTVSPVDDPPVLNSPLADQTYQEDQAEATISLASLFSDVEDPIIYTVDLNANPSLMTAVISGTTLTLTFLPDQNGINTITIKGTANGKVVYDTFFVTVQSVDDPPTIANLIPAVFVNEDAPEYLIDLTTIFADIDSPTLTKAVVSNTDSLLVNPVINGNLLKLTFQPNGYHDPIITPTQMTTITVRGTGINNSVIGSNQFTETTFNVTIAPVDDRPMLFAPIANLLVNQNSPDKFIDVTSVFGDIDTPRNLVSYAIDANDNPELVEVTVLTTTNQLQLVFQFNKFGSANITIEGTYPDQFGYTPPKKIYDTFTVYVAQVDQGPVVINPITDVWLLEDQPDMLFDLTDVFADIDSPAITKTVAVVTNRSLVTATLDGTNILRLNYAPEANVIPFRPGVVSSTLMITATADNKFTRTTFTVHITPTDDPPQVIKSFDPLVVPEDAIDTVINLATVFNDPDHDNSAITYSLVNDNPGLVSATVVSQQLTLGYLADQAGAATVLVTAHSQGLTGSLAISINVVPVDDPPYLLQQLPDIRISQDDLTTGFINLLDYFMDDDTSLDLMTYTVVMNSQPALVTPNPTVISHTLRLDYNTTYTGTTNLTVRASANGKFVDDTFSVTIFPPGNQPPMALDDMADTVPGQVIQLDLLQNDFDPNDDPMSIQSVGPAQYGTVGLNPDQTITYTPTNEYVGQDKFEYQAADIFGATMTATVTVEIYAPAVTNLTAQQISDLPLQIRLDWDYSNIETVAYFEVILESQTLTQTDNSYLDYRPTLAHETTYRYQVRAWRDNRPSATAEITITTEAAPTLDSQAQGPGTLSGQVTAILSGSQSVAEAIVCLNWLGLVEEGTQRCQTTASDGRFNFTNLALDDWHLTVSPPLSGPFTNYLPADPLIVTPTTQPTSPGHQLQLKRPNVRGQLILSTPTNRATNSLDHYVKEAPLYLTGLDDQGQVDLATVWTTTSDRRGTFHFGTLPVGRYRLQVAELPSDYPDYYLPQPVDFTIEPQTEVVELNNVLIPKAVKVIAGQVTLPNGRPATDALVEAVQTVDGTTLVKTAAVEADGRYQLLVETGNWQLQPIAVPGKAPAWTYLGSPQSVTFEQVNSVPENKTLDFSVIALDSQIKGQVLFTGHSMTQTHRMTNRDTTAAVELLNLESRAVIFQYLNQDGSFQLPVIAGDYELTIWLAEAAYPTLMAPAPIRYQATPDQTINQTITLLARDKRIYGRVTDETGQPGRFITVTSWNRQNQWFTTRTDINGAYSLVVAAGEWTVSPLLDDEATYLFEGEPVIINLDEGSSEQELNWELTRASRRVAGRFVNEAGRLIDTQATAAMIRPGSNRWLAVTPAKFGRFRLPWPDNCADCQVQVTLEAGAAQSLLADNQTAAAEAVDFLVAENNGVLQGQFLEPLTGQPMSNLSGELRLTPIGEQADRTASQVTTIGEAGQYRFSQVGAGRFNLSYQLMVPVDHQAFFNEPANALSNQRFLKQPSFPFEVELEANSSSRKNIVLETGHPFLVTVQAEANQAVTDYFPTSIRCRYSNDQQVTYACDKACFGPSWLSVCATPNDDSIISTLPTQTTLANLARPLNCTLQVADSLDAPDVAPPSAQAIPLNPGDLILTARPRPVTLQGQVVGPDGQAIGHAAVSLHSATPDGQLYTTETDDQGAYQVKVSSTAASWQIKATAEMNGLWYSGVITLSQTTADDQAVIQLDPLQLVATGQPVSSPTGGIFNQQEGTTFGLSFNTANPTARLNGLVDSPVRTLRVTIPPGAMPSTGGEVNLLISPVTVPDTGSAQLIGQGYSLQFADAGRNRRLLSPLRQPILVDLPYNQADLEAQGLEASQLRAGYFSPQRNLWTPLPATVDLVNQSLQLQLRQPVEAIAILAPQAGGQFFNPFIVPVSGVENVSPVSGITISIAANTFRNQVFVAYNPGRSSSRPGLIYTLVATDSTDSLAEPRPSQPYTITVSLPASLLAWPQLNFYYRDETGSWQLEPTSRLDLTTGTITANPTRFGVWGIFSKHSRFYLPIVAK